MLIALLAVATALPSGAEEQYAGENNRPQVCLFDMRRGAMTLMIGGDERAVAAGEAVRIDPQWTPYPSAWDPVPSRCLRGWRLSRDAPARLSADRRTVTIAAQATEGSRFRLTATYQGRAITQDFRVIRPVVSPLVGNWTQDAAACPGSAPVSELIFRRDGSFSVTFEPELHSRVDYRGRWQVRDDRLVLSDPVASSSQPPASVAAGSAYRLGDDDRLEFATAWYGHSRARPCTAAFRRVR